MLRNMARQPLRLQKRTFSSNWFWNDDNKQKQKQALPDTRPWYEKAFIYARYDLWSKFNAASFMDLLRGRPTQSSWSRYFNPSSYNPVTTMKWWAIKIISVLLAIKIIWSNIHLLFRRSDKPVIMQAGIS